MSKKLFTNTKSEEGLYAAINNETMDSHVAFIEEPGNEGIYTKDKIYQTVPSNGKDGQILFSQNGEGVWTDINILDLLSYGVEWKPDVADPVLTRVGNMNYHKTLPIQSEMKGCILNPKTKEVVYWLDESDWTYKKGGNPNKGETENLARLDGYDGEVFVYVPEFWIKSWDEPDRRCVRISPTKIDDSWEHQPAIFVGAYKDTVLNTVPEDMGYLSTLEVNSAISVANSATYCRGGDNSTTNDANEDIFKRHLGKPRTFLSRSTFRVYARQAGKEIMSYRQYKNIMYWLYVIEYANFNCQAEYNPELTAEGFHQGGLGIGLTNITNWKTYNNYFPIQPNGYTNNFGNGTGIKLIESLSLEPINNIYATRWRGIENTFGDIWSNIDGIIIDSRVSNHPDKMIHVYTTDDPAKYGDTLANIANMVLSGLQIPKEGYIKEWDLGSTAEIIPRLVGGSSTQYKCDRNFILTTSYLKGLLIGGTAGVGSNAGLGSFSSSMMINSYGSDVGYRTFCVV